MGKSPAKKRLVVWVDPDYTSTPAIQKMEEQGHTIIALEEPGPHLILSRNAIRMTPEMLATKGMLEVAVKGARLRKEGKPDEDEDDE